MSNGDFIVKDGDNEIKGNNGQQVRLVVGHLGTWSTLPFAGITLIR